MSSRTAALALPTSTLFLSASATARLPPIKTRAQGESAGREEKRRPWLYGRPNLRPSSAFGLLPNSFRKIENSW